MIETRKMTVQDFLDVMRPNESFYPEYAALSGEDKRKIALLNPNTGIAESHYLDGKLVAVAGIRHVGIGEAWFITTPDIRENHKRFLLQQTRKNLIRMRDALNLWRLFATSKISENFLEHLDFIPEPTMHVWTRV